MRDFPDLTQDERAAAVTALDQVTEACSVIRYAIDQKNVMCHRTAAELASDLSKIIGRLQDVIGNLNVHPETLPKSYDS